jgi:glycosyltransferase involved in cell wall biosynthesis
VKKKEVNNMNSKENIAWDEWYSKKNNFKKYDNVKSNLIYGSHLKKTPQVSIMIITYKRADGLKNALESAINQSYKSSYEIVVVDDSGYDEATDKLMKAYCKKYKNIVYYRHERNLGQYANWNRACELCHTKWYCLLHDDDQLVNNYLTEVTKYAFSKYNTSGIIGIYFREIDNRKIDQSQSNYKRALSFFERLFIKLRGNRLIQLKLQDNIKHIYISSCCLMINKNKVMDLGGLDDIYFPSSDFLFDSKMSYYYGVAFLPSYLALRGIGENESLKQQVCDDSIRCAFYHTKAMTHTLKYSLRSQLRKASIAAVIAEIGVKGYNDVDYGHVKAELGIKPIYNNKIIINLINLYSKFNWGVLLFRKNALKKGA